MRVLSLFLLTQSVTSFISSTQPRHASALSASRRQVIESAALASASVLVSASSALADVADGNELPDGVAQFARLIKVKSDIVVRLFSESQVANLELQIAHNFADRESSNASQRPTQLILIRRNGQI